MYKLQKWQLIKLLEYAKENGLKTIDDLIDDINKSLLNDNDIAIQFRTKEKEGK